MKQKICNYWKKLKIDFNFWTFCDHGLIWLIYLDGLKILKYLLPKTEFEEVKPFLRNFAIDNRVDRQPNIVKL